MFFVVYPGLPSGPISPAHQFQDAFPGWIQLVSCTRFGEFRSEMILDSNSLPGLSATSRTRQAEWCGKVPVRPRFGSSNRGESFETNQWPAQFPEGLVTYMPGLPSRSASVSVIQAVPGECISKGMPIRKLLDTPP